MQAKLWTDGQTPVLFGTKIETENVIKNNTKTMNTLPLCVLF